LHVLVIDDDEAIRKLLERLLTTGGHTLCWASTVDGALRLLASEEAALDCVILDINLDRDGGGYDVARKVPRDIPLIILSGMTPQEVRKGAMQVTNALQNAITILGKPFESRKLLGILQRIEKRKRPPTSSPRSFPPATNGTKP
jgi:two-component system OmpR family response regulator